MDPHDGIFCDLDKRHDVTPSKKASSKDEEAYIGLWRHYSSNVDWERERKRNGAWVSVRSCTRRRNFRLVNNGPWLVAPIGYHLLDFVAR